MATWECPAYEMITPIDWGGAQLFSWHLFTLGYLSFRNNKKLSYFLYAGISVAFLSYFGRYLILYCGEIESIVPTALINVVLAIVAYYSLRQIENIQGIFARCYENTILVFFFLLGCPALMVISPLYDTAYGFTLEIQKIGMLTPVFLAGITVIPACIVYAIISCLKHGHTQREDVGRNMRSVVFLGASIVFLLAILTSVDVLRRFPYYYVIPVFLAVAGYVSVFSTRHLLWESFEGASKMNRIKLHLNGIPPMTFILSCVLRLYLGSIM